MTAHQQTGEIAPVIVRASSTTGYADCNRRGAARMFRREIEAAGFRLRRIARSVGACIGSAVHLSASTTLREKAEKGALPPLSVGLDAAMEGLKQQAETAEDGVLFDGNGPARNMADAEAQTRSMATAYHHVIAPQVEPILVETRLEARFSPLLIVSCQSDVVAREPNWLRDLKTGKRQSTHNPQIGCYSITARTHGYQIDQAAIDFVKRVSVGPRAKSPQPPPTTTFHSVALVENAALNVLRHIENDLLVFRHGDPERRLLAGDPWAFAANPSSILCGPKYCEAWGTDFCREHAEAEENA